MSRRLDRLPPFRTADTFRAVLSYGRYGSSPAGSRVYYYGYGRQALGDAFHVCGAGPGDTILYPDFVCDVTLEPIHRLGLKVAYYPVEDTLLPDWENLEWLAAESSAVAVMSVNYFGFPQPMNRWRQLIRKSGLAWVNDNAHGYGSGQDGISLDAFGDVSITSMRKVLPLINGAALRVNRADLSSRHRPMPPASVVAHLPIGEELRRFGRSISRSLGISPAPPGAKPFSRLPLAEETAARNRAMDPLSRCLLRSYDRRLTEFAYRRRRLYDAWQESLTTLGLRPLFPFLPPDVSPMLFPCYAADFDDRQRWLRWAAERNVDAYPWPSLPAACRQDGSRAVARWQRLLCFPIHPFMQLSEIRDRFR